MAHTVDYAYQGKFLGEAKHLASGMTLGTDVGKEIGGAESSFSPTDLLAAALASCTLATMDLVAQRDGVSLTGATVGIEKTMSDGKPLRVAVLRLTIRLPHIPEPLRAKLERVATKCPVHNSLHPEMKVELVFEYAA
jgi:uncharacterized OsmC-like protein